MSDYKRLIQNEVAHLRATTVKPPHIKNSDYSETLEIIAARKVKARQSVIDEELSNQNLERLS